MTKNEKLNELKNHVVPLIDKMPEEKQYLVLGVITGINMSQEKNKAMHEAEIRKTG